MQRDDFDRWKAIGQGKFNAVPDLEKELRPQIDAVSLRLLDALTRLRPHLANPDVQRRLSERAAAILVGEGIHDAARDAALKPLRR